MRPFFEVLRELRKGKTLAELTEKIHELVAEVRAHGGSGTLTLSITVTRMKGIRDDRIVSLSPKVALKLPKTPDESSLFYADAGNSLHRSDPDQTELQLSAVDGGKKSDVPVTNEGATA